MLWAVAAVIAVIALGVSGLVIYQIRKGEPEDEDAPQKDADAGETCGGLHPRHLHDAHEVFNEHAADIAPVAESAFEAFKKHASESLQTAGDSLGKLVGPLQKLSRSPTVIISDAADAARSHLDAAQSSVQGGVDKVDSAVPTVSSGDTAAGFPRTDVDEVQRAVHQALNDTKEVAQQVKEAAAHALSIPGAIAEDVEGITSAAGLACDNILGEIDTINFSSIQMFGDSALQGTKGAIEDAQGVLQQAASVAEGLGLDKLRDMATKALAEMEQVSITLRKASTDLSRHASLFKPADIAPMVTKVTDAAMPVLKQGQEIAQQVSTLTVALALTLTRRVCCGHA